MLNRFSNWMDVASWLPYEGKVVLKNKQARTTLVRLPGWVARDEVSCYIDEKRAEPGLAGNYLIFAGLKGNEEIRLQFPVPQRTDQYTIHNKLYTVEFRGSTVISMTPQDTDPTAIPMFARGKMEKGKPLLIMGPPPMIKVRRFVADRLIPLP